MRTLATLVLHEQNGQPAIGYRAETISQIACGDLAEGTQAEWELRCWTPVLTRPGHGLKAKELVVLFGATFRLIEHCLGYGTPSDAVRRLQCDGNGTVTAIPNMQPLHDHLMIWSNQATLNDVFLQTRHVDIAQLQSTGQYLQRIIEEMMSLAN